MATWLNFSVGEAIEETQKKKRRQKKTAHVLKKYLDVTIFVCVIQWLILQSLTVTSKYVDLFYEKLFQSTEGFY